MGVLGHRGSRAGGRENTLAAFAAALAEGADGVELDARAGADGTVVVHHDAEVDDLGPVSGLAAPGLPDWLPTLAAALEACRGALVDVEVKASPAEESGPARLEALARRVATLACDGGAARPGVFVTSFWPAALDIVRGERPEVTTGLLVHPGLDAGDALGQALSLGCGVLLPFHSQVDAPLVARATDAGVAVATWTVNEPDDLRRAADLGVDAVITDDVPGALAVLGR